MKHSINQLLHHFVVHSVNFDPCGLHRLSNTRPAHISGIGAAKTELGSPYDV